jgi:hypothetical protein
VNAVEILAEAHRRGIEVYAEGSVLRVRDPRGTMDKSFLQLLRSEKFSIMGALTRAGGEKEGALPTIPSLAMLAPWVNPDLDADDRALLRAVLLLDRQRAEERRAEREQRGPGVGGTPSRVEDAP